MTALTTKKILERPTVVDQIIKRSDWSVRDKVTQLEIIAKSSNKPQAEQAAAALSLLKDVTVFSLEKIAQLQTSRDQLEKRIAEIQVTKFIKSVGVFELDKDASGTLTITKDANGQLVLHGYVSDGLTDRDGDKMGKNALLQMKDALNSGNVLLFANHEHNIGDTLGTFARADIDSKGLWAEAVLESPEKNANVASLLSKLETGMRLGLSIGGDMAGHHDEKEFDEAGKPRRVRVIDGVKLYEVSAVALPANPRAVITSVTRR